MTATLAERAMERLAALKAQREATSDAHDEAERKRSGLGDGRWKSRHRWGQPRHRKPPKRHVDPKARPAARCRSLPRGRRKRRQRRFTGPSGHRRRTPHELRRLLAQGGFAGWMHDSISAALKDEKRSVVICASCGGLTICPSEDADKRWAEHTGNKNKQSTRVRASERPTVPHLSGTKRQRRLTLHRLRRMHRQRSSGGLLAQVRDHWQAKGWEPETADTPESGLGASSGSDRSRERLLDPPSLDDAPSERFRLHTEFARPTRDCHGATAEGQQDIAAGVAGLFDGGRPSAVAGLVVPVAVDPVDAVPGAGLGTHVGEEVLERVPPTITDANASASVEVVARACGSGAARLHVLPSRVFGRSNAAVLEPTGCFATATTQAPCPDVAGPHLLDSAATTPADGVSLASSTPARALSDDCEGTEDLPNDGLGLNSAFLAEFRDAVLRSTATGAGDSRVGDDFQFTPEVPYRFHDPAIAKIAESARAVGGRASAITANTGSNNWAGGAGWVGGVEPTASDDVTIPASATVTIASGTTALCRSLNVQASATLAFAATTSVLTIGDASGGAATFSSTCTVTLTGIGTINFVASQSAATFSLTTGGRVMPNLTVNTAGATAATIQFADAVTATSATITLTAGKVDANSQSVNCGKLSSANSTTRTLTLGSSAITSTNAGTSADFSTITNLTITANTATMTLSGSSAFFNSGGTPNWNGLSLLFTGSGAPQMSVNTGVTFANVTRTGTAVKTDSFVLAGGFTVTSTFTVTGNSLTNRVLMSSTVMGTTRTVTVNGSVSLTNVDFQDITSAGTAGTWTGTSLGDALGNTGITFTVNSGAANAFGGVDRYLVATGNWSTTGVWSTTTGGATGASVPLPQDTVIMNAASGVVTVTDDMPRSCRQVTCTGFTGNWSTSSGGTSTTVYGNVTLGSGMSAVPSGNTLTFAGRSAQTITSAGKAIAAQVLMNGPGGTYTQQDALSVNRTDVGAFTLTAGTWAANGQTFASPSLLSTGTATRALSMGSGAWTLNAATAISVWNMTSTGMTLTASTAVVSCTGAPGGAITITVTTGGVTMPNWTVNGGANLTCQFSDAFTTAGTITLTSGKLDTNNQAVSCLTLNFGNNVVRTLTAGSSAITCTNAGNAFVGTATTNLTVSSNTATVTASGAAAVIGPGTMNYNGMSFSMTGSGVAQFQNGPTVANFSRIGTAVNTDALSLNANPVVTGIMTVTGQSVTNRVLVQSSVLGTPRTVTVNTTVTSTNADWQDITSAGTASWNLSAASGGSGNALGNTGITFTTQQTNYWVGNGGSWSDVTHWASTSNGAGSSGRVPLPQDTARIDSSSITSGSQTITTDMPRAAVTVDFTGVANNPAYAVSVAATVFGSFTGGTMTRASWPGTLTLGGRSSLTITMNGFTQFGGLIVNAFGGTYTLQDAFTNAAAAAFTLTTGTVNSNNQTVSTGQFVSTGSAARTLTMGSSVWSFTITSASSAWSVTASLTMNANTSTIVLSVASTNTRTFAGAGLVYSNLTYTVAASSGALVVTGANTFATVTVTNDTTSKTLTLPAATSTTIATLVLGGVNSHLLTVNSSAGASAATIALTNAFEGDFLSVQDITVTGAQALAIDSNNVSGNTGVTFSPPDVIPVFRQPRPRTLLQAIPRAARW